MVPPLEVAPPLVVDPPLYVCFSWGWGPPLEVRMVGGYPRSQPIPWRAAAEFALPKEPPLDQVACSIAAWLSRKFPFHLYDVLAVVGISSYLSLSVGKLFLSRMELIAMAVIHASKMRRAVCDAFF